MTLTARAPTLSDYRHWVFDMDGTLTEAAHDFALIRRALDIPPEADILHHLAALPADEAATKHAWLLEHERALAQGARAAPGAVALVRALHAAGCRLGMLTRNARELAKITLQAIGLDDAFAWDDIVGRDEAAPKPAPDGLHYFAQRWSVQGSALVMAHQCAGMTFAQVSPDVSYVRIATAVTAPALRDVSTDWLFKREG